MSFTHYSSTFVFIILLAIFKFSDCFDPLDPNGNITITFDIYEWTGDGYVARVTIQNYYQYRYIEKPGWSIGWKWTNKEIIWSIFGAFATIQGDCTRYKYQKPHSCLEKPVITDLMPDASSEKTNECCRGGLLSAWAIDPSSSFSSFNITVGNLNTNSNVSPPANLTLLGPGPGYTCGPLLETNPTQSSYFGGKRIVQVYKTWKSACTYSSFLANKRPICCVSLSTFYNPKITSCPDCSCGCKETNQNNLLCIREGSSLSLLNLNSADVVHCTDHMCPIKVHWHIKNNYMTHWRVKLTISNYNYNRNYSNWNVLVQHPGFSQNAATYSFNSTMLPTLGFTDKVALFWGLPFYNAELVQANDQQLGSVTSDILLEKDLSTFTLSNGWGLPRRIYFSGEECGMPPPDTFPILPNGCCTIKLPPYILLLFIVYFNLEISIMHLSQR